MLCNRNSIDVFSLQGGRKPLTRRTRCIASDADTKWRTARCTAGAADSTSPTFNASEPQGTRMRGETRRSRAQLGLRKPPRYRKRSKQTEDRRRLAPCSAQSDHPRCKNAEGRLERKGHRRRPRRRDDSRHRLLYGNRRQSAELHRSGHSARKGLRKIGRARRPGQIVQVVPQRHQELPHAVLPLAAQRRPTARVRRNFRGPDEHGEGNRTRRQALCSRLSSSVSYSVCPYEEAGVVHFEWC